MEDISVVDDDIDNRMNLKNNNKKINILYYVNLFVIVIRCVLYEKR